MPERVKLCSAMVLKPHLLLETAEIKWKPMNMSGLILGYISIQYDGLD